jgi:hypothetical protein
MAKCVNNNCNNDALNSISAVCVSVDGDFACCPACEIEYKKQRDHFFNVTVHSEELTTAYLLGK